MTSAPHDLTDFLGDWALSRAITDRQADKSGHLEGTAVFKRDADRLHYTETGELSYEGAPPLVASRTYFWERAEEGGVLVRFDDGRPFHSFTLLRTMPEAQHICDPDMYYVTYSFGNWPKWQSEWRVVGPRKDYVIISKYRRVR